MDTRNRARDATRRARRVSRCAADRRRRLGSGNGVELVEREKEIDGLLACLRVAARGSGRMVLLGGEAGIGKTSLLQALADRRDDALLWWGACDALQTPHPLAPLHDIARSSSVGFRGLMSTETDRAALFEAVLSELQLWLRRTPMHLTVCEEALDLSVPV